MSVTNSLNDFNQVLEAAANVASTLTPWVGPIKFAIEELWDFFHKANPDATVEDFREWLRTQGGVVVNLTDEWARSKGYVQNDDGTWSLPPTPTPADNTVDS